MKYLKKYKTFELNDNTYLSAADKLQRNHPKRARKLRKWVDDNQNINIDYLDPRPLYSKDNVYYITNVNVSHDTYTGLGNNINVDIESVNDIYTLMFSNWNDPDSEHSLSMSNNIRNNGTPWFQPPGYTRKDDKSIYEFPKEFYFDDRKSSKIFMDIFERESGEKLLCSVNDMYKS